MTVERDPSAWHAGQIAARRRATPGVRTLMTWIALAIIVLTVVSGLAYQALWLRAGEDPARLLPRDTSAYVSSSQLGDSATRARALDRWRDAAVVEPEMVRLLETDGAAEVAGLPLGFVLSLVPNAASLQVALVPTPNGPTILGFLGLSESRDRALVRDQLDPLRERAGRHVGFTVDEVRHSPWQRYAGVDGDAPWVVEMDPHLVFAWGAYDGLEDLLDARVAGREDAIRRRDGYRPIAGEDTVDGEIRATFDPRALWSAVVGESTRTGGRLIDAVSLVTVTSRVTGDDEVAEIQAKVRDRSGRAALPIALRKTNHGVRDHLPSDADIALSLATDDPFTLAAGLRTVLTRLSEELDEPRLETLFRRLLDVEVERVRIDWEVATSFAGEIGVAAWLDKDRIRWAIVGRWEQPLVCEQAMTRLLPFILGDDLAYGRVIEDGRPIHLVREPDRLRSDDGEELAWALMDDVIIVAPDLATLRMMTSSQNTMGSPVARGLPTETELAVTASPKLLKRLGTAWTTMIGDALRPDFRLGMTLEVNGSWLEFTANMGMWSTMLPLMAADASRFDDLTLPGLDPRCRAAHDAMCERFPNAVPCHAFQVGRADRIARACRALGLVSAAAPAD